MTLCVISKRDFVDNSTDIKSFYSCSSSGYNWYGLTQSVSADRRMFYILVI